MSSPRAPADRAEVVEVIAEAVAFNWRDSMQHKALNILAALEAAGVRLVPVEPLERQLVGGMIRPDYYRALAASPYAPEGE